MQDNKFTNSQQFVTFSRTIKSALITAYLADIRTKYYLVIWKKEEMDEITWTGTAEKSESINVSAPEDFSLGMLLKL